MTSKYNSICVERDSDPIIVMDTTLRDGEQNALCTMYSDDKIMIAESLEEMNVDIIEAGFAASCGNLEVMKEIAGIVKRPYLCGLSRAVVSDIDATYKAYQEYDKRMIHIFLPTSKEQVDAKLKKSYQELVDLAVSSVKYATERFPVVEFTAEDSTRSNQEFLRTMYQAVVREGASVVNVADTVGCADPEYFGELVSKVSGWVKEVNSNARVSVHCHNDLGLAFANTLSGIKNGARQVEGTILGIGERAGNCALEQIVAYSKIHPKIYTTSVDSRKLYNAAKIVEEVTGVANPLAPVVGESAFSHKSGIHQHGVINSRCSYEALNPEDFGRKSQIVIGPCSGYHGVVAKAMELGFNITKEKAMKVIERVSEMVKRKIKKRFSDSDIKEMLESIS